MSRAFYERGWRGLHVAPAGDRAALLRQHRPDEVVLEAIFAAVRRAADTTSGAGPGALVEHRAAERVDGQGPGARRQAVGTVRLTQALEMAPFRDTHGLRIDVEGDEAAVISGRQAERFRPWLVIVQAAGPLSGAHAVSKW